MDAKLAFAVHGCTIGSASIFEKDRSSLQTKSEAGSIPVENHAFFSIFRWGAEGLLRASFVKCVRFPP
ncbi:hypothetical protein BCU91_18980 [Shewanella sp. 10N.286.52.B9]|nr:hypothetical protein BCU91_18980 [Shewanella sp. 10N.286.52.B9]